MIEALGNFFIVIVAGLLVGYFFQSLKKEIIEVRTYGKHCSSGWRTMMGISIFVDIFGICLFGYDVYVALKILLG